VVALGASTVLLAGAPWFLVAVLAAVVNGVANIVVEVTSDTALQEMLPEDVFARAYGLVIPAACAAIAAGSLVAPVLVHLLGLNGSLIALTLVSLSYTVALRRPARVGEHRVTTASVSCVALASEPLVEAA
jgi:MFS family permease